MDLRPYLDVEAALARKLRLEWRRQAVQVFAQMQGHLSKGEYDAARAVVDLIDLGTIAKKHRAFVKYMLWATAVFGAKVVARKPLISSIRNEPLLNQIADNFVLTLAYGMTQAVRDEALQLIATAEETVTKAERPRFVKPFVSFAKGGDDKLKLISSLHSSRLATWGFTAEAEVRGVSTYRLTAVLDGRTSEYCRMIHGKEFEVEHARSAITTVLSAQNPDDVKVLQPWPKQTKASIAELSKLSAAELTARNLHIPPFHPGCRTLCVLVGSRIVGEQAVDWSEDETPMTQQTPDDFSGLGLRISASDLERWNKVVGQSPTQILAGLLGKDVADLAGLGKQSKFFSFRKDGTVKFSVQGELAGAGTKVAVSQVYDPLASQLYMTQTDFAKTTWRQSSSFVKELYRRSAGTAKALGASGLTATTDGKFGLYSHAQFGFVPATAASWTALRNDLLMDLTDGGRLAHVWTALPQHKSALLKLVLNSKDPKGLWVLAGMTDKVKGVAVGRLLLEGRTATIMLPLTDKEAMARFGGHFG